jgi:cellulose synthase/poly-beta-1,6-N-acetylglucosamine synthase-like glycosyltransferase
VTKLAAKNAILTCCYNQTPEQLELTKHALASAFAQDVEGGADVYAVDNGSTDNGETAAWLSSLQETNLYVEYRLANISPVKLSNRLLWELFGLGYAHVLCTSNDVLLPPNLYREFLRWPRGLVTASQTSEPATSGYGPLQQVVNERAAAHTTSAISECTPLAVALIRRWFHDALVARDGYFLDERFFNYCSDCDLALRMASCGCRGVQLSLPYWHYGSASHHMLDPERARLITSVADEDRARFVAKWGMTVDSLEYGACAADINFRGEGN